MIGKKFTDLEQITEPNFSDQVFVHTSSGAKRLTLSDLLRNQSNTVVDGSSMSRCTLQDCEAEDFKTDDLTASANVAVGGDLSITGTTETAGNIKAESGTVSANEFSVGSADVTNPTGIQFWKGGTKKGHFVPTNTGISFEQDNGIGAFEMHGPIEVYGTNTYIDFHANNSSDDYSTRIINYGSQPDTLVFMKPADTGVNLARCIGNFQTSSSRKLKKNIAPISDYEAIDKIMEMDPVTFDYKWGDSSCGFIAEDMLSILPEAVNVPEGYDEETFEYTGIESAAEAPSIDYTKIIPYLVKVVQTQQEEIEKLKSKVRE
jgi:hypothetical protein